jgi:AAA+ superfamily predicted ATPase
MIIGFFGNVRQGKTLSAVRELYKLYQKGYKIYSNTHLNFPYIPLTLDFILDIIEKDLELPDDSVFFIDEIYMFGLDSRSSMTRRNRAVTYFLLQTGKMNGKNSDWGLILIFTAQYPDQIDKRLRHVMDVGVECEKIEHLGCKYFAQKFYVYKGSKSFSYSKVFKGTLDIYKLYDTRKRIVMQKDRYKEEAF